MTTTGTITTTGTTGTITTTGTTVTTAAVSSAPYKEYYYTTTPYTVNATDLSAYLKELTSTNITLKSTTKLAKDPNTFINIIQYKPEKVYGFEFADGTKIKTIRDDKDVFSLPYAFYLALAKKIYGKELTFEGVLAKAKELSYSKYHVKLVKEGLKFFKKKQEEEAKKKQEEKDKKEQHKRYIEKKKKRDKKLQERYDEEFINLVAKAIKKGKEED